MTVLSLVLMSANYRQGPPFTHWVASMPDVTVQAGLASGPASIAASSGGCSIVAQKVSGGSAGLVAVSLSVYGQSRNQTRLGIVSDGKNFLETAAQCVAADSSGNRYHSGYTQTVHAGLTDAVIVLLDSSGTYLGSTSMGDKPSLGYSTGFSPCGLTIDSSDNLLAVGTISGSYGTLTAVLKFPPLTAAPSAQATITTAQTTCLQIDTDSSNNVYVAGRTGGGKALLVKLDSSLSQQWARSLASAAGGDTAHGVTCDASGNVYVAGRANTGGTPYYFIAKYNTSGTLQWQRKLTAISDNDVGGALAVDASANVYFVGSVGSVSDSTTGTFYIAKYNTSGAIQWQRTLGPNAYAAYGLSAGIASSTLYVLGGNPSSQPVVLSVPTDGTLTGTYDSYVYGSGALTDAAGTMTGATETLTTDVGRLDQSSVTIVSRTPTYTVNDSWVH